MSGASGNGGNGGGGSTRDVVVIGSSLGGIEALKALAERLPAGLPASVLVVQHTSERSPGQLADILAGRGPLPAITATDGMPLRHGSIVVAPPGMHMLLDERGIRVVFGPRENLSRPAIDPLFRTAAVHYRSRVVGVVLTGLLGDGSVGLHAIHRCGGVSVVQDPGEAAAPDMPRRALDLVPGAHTVRLADMPALLARLVAERAPEPPPVPEALQIETAITERAMSGQEPADVPGRSTDFTCPECNGAITELDDGGVRRYRCRVGHAFSAEGMVAAKEESTEESLWVALQTLKERAQMLDTMSREESARGRDVNAAAYRQRAQETHAHADRLRALIQQVVM